jgi:hypothetical protein
MVDRNINSANVLCHLFLLLQLAIVVPPLLCPETERAAISLKLEAPKQQYSSTYCSEMEKTSKKSKKI